jgi:hypothetical protein
MTRRLDISEYIEKPVNLNNSISGVSLNDSSINAFVKKTVQIGKNP